MRKFCHVDIKDDGLFKQKIVQYTKRIHFAVICDSNNYYEQNSSKVDYHTYNYLAGIDFISEISGDLEILNNKKGGAADWLFGYLSYDLKNELESLYSSNRDELNFPKMFFFQPRYIFKQIAGRWEVGYCDTMDDEKSVGELISSIENENVELLCQSSQVNFNSRVDKEKYLQSVKAILNHIHKGDIYELNYCMEFFSDNSTIDPYLVYNELVRISPTPFSSFVKVKSRYIISASPERYLKKESSKLICQPIKGTAARGKDVVEDQKLRKALKSNVKEVSENVMIADLVRNDLSKVASKGSVSIEELCGVYSFRQVFQMITTVVAELEPGRSDLDAIMASFPMGSMTGAPKLRAMKLIEKFEDTKRGVYSGAIGYFSPDGDFDFNVVIRSLLYDSVKKYLSFMVGSAITEKSIPEQEYAECLLKAKAILKIFNKDESCHDA